MNALSNAFYAAANYVHKLLIVVTKRVEILIWWMAEGGDLCIKLSKFMK